ncbi:hypothetical protein EMCRGX_G010607 [Ephydatia muelleri]
MAAGNLVDYSSSSSSCESAEEDERVPSSKKIRINNVTPCVPLGTMAPADKESLPLPDAILNMFQAEEPRGNHGNHEGRVRSFPHMRGNWPSFAHIPFSLEEHDLAPCIASYHHTLCALLSHSGTLHMVHPPEVHISLSRTVPIRHHWIEPLVCSLKNCISGHKRFFISFSGPEVYSNDEKTRSFIGLKVSKGHNKLCALVHDVDECFGKFGLQPFYKDPVFHISVCWCLGDILPMMSESLQMAIEVSANILQECLWWIIPSIPVREREAWRTVTSEHKIDQSDCYEIIDIRYKTGNKLFTFVLS